MLFIIFYVLALLLFVTILIYFSRINRKKKYKVDSEQEDNSDYLNIFDSNYKKIMSPIDGFIKKDYLENYLKSEAKIEKQKGIIVKIQPVQGNLSEELASKCGEIIKIEFNGNSICACEVNTDEPNYIFWIYITDVDEQNGEIFVINAIQRLMEFTGIEFNFIIKNVEL